MTADEIRKIEHSVGHPERDCAIFLQEIAAQLAELNERLDKKGIDVNLGATSDVIQVRNVG